MSHNRSFLVPAPHCDAALTALMLQRSAVPYVANPYEEELMKRTIGLVVLSSTLAFGGLAWAQGNSESGLDRYLSNPGREQATEVGAECDTGAGSGAFGYFGKDNNLAGGADGTATGLANSSLCGNRQGDLP